MARKARHSRFESRTSRLKLAIKPKPHTGPAIGDGVTLLYRRRSQANGTWVLKAAVGDGQSRTYWTKRIGEADDYDAADGEKVLTFFQAARIVTTTSLNYHHDVKAFTPRHCATTLKARADGEVQINQHVGSRCGATKPNGCADKVGLRHADDLDVCHDYLPPAAIFAAMA